MLKWSINPVSNPKPLRESLMHVTVFLTTAVRSSDPALTCVMLKQSNYQTQDNKGKVVPVLN
jgi:hypothetical protein